MQIQSHSFDSPLLPDSNAKAAADHRSWQRLCELYLPVRMENSIWRFSRARKPTAPVQGWKLHISATILDACRVFEKVARYLTAQDVQFKAPQSLDDLAKINCGLQFGYAQVGKFITVYPDSEKKAVNLASKLHRLTRDFFAVSIPFDRQFQPQSSVFYRYGGFILMEKTNRNGRKFPVIRNPGGDFQIDDRFQFAPDWAFDPFYKFQNAQKLKSNAKKYSLPENYQVFRAFTQRGKGGTYQALDFSTTPPRFCIVKEGRLNGEIGWNGQDGYALVKNEFRVLSELNKSLEIVPRVYANFELDGNFYLVMENIEGESLYHLMKRRRRRFSIKQILGFAVEITKIIEKTHEAGWIWNDCKPANLIVAGDRKIRPIDFENSYPIHQTAPFDWQTAKFSRPANEQATDHRVSDLFALGSVVYYLLTAKLFDRNAPISIAKLRHNVPPDLIKITETLLCEDIDGAVFNAAEVRRSFENIRNAFD